MRRRIECCYRVPVAKIFQGSRTDIDKRVTHFQFVFERTGSRHKTSRPVSFHRETPQTASDTSSHQVRSSDQASAPSAVHAPFDEAVFTTHSIDLASCPPLIESIPFHTSARNAAALQYFLEVPALKIAYNMACYFFTVTLPQATWSHPAIMESMVALSTLSASLRGSSSAKWTSSPPLCHYNKAIEALVLSNPTRNVTLLVCILLWLYEQFDNQHDRALFHRASISKILMEWRTNELGQDRCMDQYIASYVEPSIVVGLEITAPVKLCREVLGTLSLTLTCSIDSRKQCTYDDALMGLRNCIDCFTARAGENEKSLLKASLVSLQKWNYQFEHYTGSHWTVLGPILLSYATAVAMLAQKAMPTKEAKDADWQRSLKFLRAESLKIGSLPDEKADHRSLLHGIDRIVRD